VLGSFLTSMATISGLIRTLLHDAVNRCIKECVKGRTKLILYGKFRRKRSADELRHFYNKVRHGFVGVVVITAAICSVFVELKICGKGRTASAGAGVWISFCFEADVLR
jgi:hypothetical protein